MYQILITDDIPANIKILGEILKSYYNIIVANNGFKALELAKEKKPDLILLDIMMPEMDGYKVCSLLKEDKDTSDIPVIFITAKNQIEDITKGFEVGGVDYIIKPFNPQEVLVRVKNHLSLKKAKDELIQTVIYLQEALTHVKKLNGILPICSNCKKVRDDQGYWEQVEDYLAKNYEAMVSHSLCPDCIRILYPQLADKILDNLDSK